MEHSCDLRIVLHFPASMFCFDHHLLLSRSPPLPATPRAAFGACLRGCFAVQLEPPLAVRSVAPPQVRQPPSLDQLIT